MGLKMPILAFLVMVFLCGCSTHLPTAEEYLSAPLFISTFTSSLSNNRPVNDLNETNMSNERLEVDLYTMW